MNPITEVQDRLIDLQMERHAWLLKPRPDWREEDRRNGIIWEDELNSENHREAVRANNATASNQ